MLGSWPLAPCPRGAQLPSEAPCWGCGARPPWSQAEPAGVGLPHSCVVSRGKHSEYVNVSDCWREIYNPSSYWERARLPEAPKCSVPYNVCFMANGKICKICTQTVPCLVDRG